MNQKTQVPVKNKAQKLDVQKSHEKSTSLRVSKQLRLGTGHKAAVWA